MEKIQELLEVDSFLSPRQIIEYMAEQFMTHDKYLDWEAFYDIIVGVFGKKPKPITRDELDEQKAELRKRGVYLSSFYGGDGFLVDDYDLPIGKHLRFYLNAHDSAGRKQILESIVGEFKDARGFKVKTVGTADYGFSRLDNTILYVGVNDATRYVDGLRRLSSEHPESFDNEVPLMTRKLGKGIGYAVSSWRSMVRVLGDPMRLTDMSYTMAHSAVLQRTFDKAIRDGMEDYAAITEVYKHALLGARFDPENPYLNAGMKEPFEVVGVGI